MTERPDAAGHHDDDTTDGHDDVRRLLSSLKDPGPMPPDLVRRISASLAEEQSRREGAPQHGTVHSLDTAREQRSLARRLPAIAVAASVAVLAGAAILGVLTDRGMIGSGADSADSVAGTDMLTATAMDDSAADSAAESAAGAADGAAADEGAAEQDATPMARSMAPTFTASGTLVTSTTVSDLVVELRHRTPLPEDSAARRALDDSTVSSPTDAADCLSGILAEPADDLRERVDAVDTVEFNGALRALIVLTDDPAQGSGPEDPATAYLVPLDCRRDSATLLHEPVRVA